MYIKKFQGPRTMQLPYGNFMGCADMPQKFTKRWVVSRKATVVNSGAVLVYFIERAFNLYVLSHDEHTIWEIAVAHYGERALGVTSLKNINNLKNNLLFYIQLLKKFIGDIGAYTFEQNTPETSKSTERILGHTIFNVHATDLGEEGVDFARLYDCD